VVADSIVGQNPSDERLAIPIGEIEKLEKRKLDALATTGLIVGSVVLVLGTLVVVAAAAASSFGSFGSGP
jgi:hypothetical protein